VAGNCVTTAEIQQHFIKYQDDADVASKNRVELLDGAESRLAKKVAAVSREKDTGGISNSFISLW